MKFDNTVRSAVNELNELDGLIERFNAARDGADISFEDIHMAIEVFTNIRESILSSVAYPPLLFGERVLA